MGDKVRSRKVRDARDSDYYSDEEEPRDDMELNDM